MNAWFQRLSPDGTRVASSGLHLDGDPLGVVGHGPVWRDQFRVVFHTDRPEPGTFQIDTRNGEVTQVYPLELVELAGGGGLWAGVEPGRGIHLSDGRFIAGAGQPAMATNGVLIYRVGDDKIEPSISTTARAWGDGRGAIFSDFGNVTVAGPEFRPICIDTPVGPWLLTMTHTTLRLRPFNADRGYERHTGDNQNLHSDAIFRHGRGEIHVVYQNHRGEGFRWEQSLSAELKPFPGPTAPPKPQPEPTPEPPMPPPAADLGAFGRRFMDLVAGTNAADYGAVIARIQPQLWPFGVGSQNRSNGIPSSRLFLPWEGCRNVAPRPFNERDLHLGVRQDTPEAWKSTVDTVWPPEAPAVWLLHGRMGPEYVPLDVPAPTPTPTPQPPPSVDLSGLIRRIDEQDVKIATLEQALRKKVALKSAHGYYVCAEPSGLVVANREVRGGWEEFEVER